MLGVDVEPRTMFLSSYSHDEWDSYVKNKRDICQLLMGNGADIL